MLQCCRMTYDITIAAPGSSAGRGGAGRGGAGVTFAAHFLAAAAGRGWWRAHCSVVTTLLAGNTGLWCPLGADGLGLTRTSVAAASSPALGMVQGRPNTATIGWYRDSQSI